ncbi:predicted protein [Thalassiosira pseudonana CCMP1335]|uniref:Uncharacterized protein n=1 Tax=Thalassiosira pseudonana TaxID=35128 RepID=B8BWQ3_THAPS|nr:predicted protein [Thalassiosira pseudonana CCMP1335]EED93569.1 predicted protein [Thalassiosira pseudonana CCMP1335]
MATLVIPPFMATPPSLATACPSLACPARAPAMAALAVSARRAASLTKSFIARSAGACRAPGDPTRRERAAYHQTPQLGHELGRFLLTQRAGKVQLRPPRVHLQCWRRCTNSGGAPTCICKQRNGWCTMQRNLFSYELSKKTLRIGRYNTSDS